MRDESPSLQFNCYFRATQNCVLRHFFFLLNTNFKQKSTTKTAKSPKEFVGKSVLVLTCSSDEKPLSGTPGVFRGLTMNITTVKKNKNVWPFSIRLNFS